MEEIPLATTGCSCGHDDETPTMDVRAIPHAIRHAAVFGAFDAIQPGKSLVIVAPHNPIPLLNQLNDRAPIEVAYLSEGPEAWHVQITRKVAAQ